MKTYTLAAAIAGLMLTVSAQAGPLGGLGGQLGGSLGGGMAGGIGGLRGGFDGSGFGEAALPSDEMDTAAHAGARRARAAEQATLARARKAGDTAERSTAQGAASGEGAANASLIGATEASVRSVGGANLAEGASGAMSTAGRAPSSPAAAEPRRAPEQAPKAGHASGSALNTGERQTRSAAPASSEADSARAFDANATASGSFQRDGSDTQGSAAGAAAVTH